MSLPRAIRAGGVEAWGRKAHVNQGASGDLAPLVERNRLRWADLVEIGDVITGKVTGRSYEQQISLFESHGMGLQDLYVAAEVLKSAREHNVGIDLPIAA